MEQNDRLEKNKDFFQGKQLFTKLLLEENDDNESCDSWMKKYDPLTRSMLVDFQKMEHKKKLKALAFISIMPNKLI